MNSDVLYLVFFVVLIIALLAYINIKEREAGVKFSKLQNELEDLQRQLHYVKKEREAAGAAGAGEVGVGGVATGAAGVVASGGAGGEDYALALIKEELKIELERDLSARMAPVLSSIKIIENLIDQFQDEQQSRLLKLEQQTQSMTKLRPNFENEEERIISLFNEGKSIEQIAKDLRIGTGNVELVLKFKKLLK